MMKTKMVITMITTNTIIRSYSELSKLTTYQERYAYLKLNGKVGRDTFGFDRYLNQAFYMSEEWKRARREVIARDNGRDLGVLGYDIVDLIIVHHMNKITMDDIINRSPYLLDPEYLISTSLDTHNAIHFGKNKIIEPTIVTRFKNDMCPWKKI